MLSTAAPPPPIQFSLWHTFKHHIPRFLLTILVDIVLPLVIYLSLQKHTRPVVALLIASSPPLTMVILKAVCFCTFDVLGFTVFFTFAISAIVAIVTRNPIILLLEKSLVTGVISMVFAISLIPCHCGCQMRPLAYYFYQDLVPTNRRQLGLDEHLSNDEHEPTDDHFVQLKEEIVQEHSANKKEVAEVYEWIYNHCPPFRFSCQLITGIWAFGFLLEFLARLTLIVLHLSVNRIVIYGHVILTSITVLCVASSALCIAIERKQTLAFIERWKSEQVNGHRRRRSTDMLSLSVASYGYSNDVLIMDV
jgi:hypothetical protein